MFQVTSDKTYKLGEEGWHVTISAATPEELVQRVQEFDAWWAARKKAAKEQKKAASTLKLARTDEEIEQILDEYDVGQKDQADLDRK